MAGVEALFLLGLRLRIRAITYLFTQNNQCPLRLAMYDVT